MIFLRCISHLFYVNKPGVTWYLNTSFYMRIYAYNKSVTRELAAWNIGLSWLTSHAATTSNMRMQRRGRRYDLRIVQQRRILSDPLSLPCASEPLNRGDYLQSSLRSAVRSASEKHSEALISCRTRGGEGRRCERNLQRRNWTDYRHDLLNLYFT